MSPHPLPPGMRWVGFPMLATAGAAASGAVWSGLAGLSVKQEILDHAACAVAAAGALAPWPKLWTALLIAPALSYAAVSLSWAAAFDTPYVVMVAELWKTPIGTAAALLAAAIAALHHAHLRAPRRPGCAWAALAAYAFLPAVVLFVVAWGAKSQAAAAGYGAILGLGQVAAARITLAWARRSRAAVLSN